MLYVTIALVSTLALITAATRPLAVVGLSVLLFFQSLPTLRLLLAAGLAALRLQHA